MAMVAKSRKMKANSAKRRWQKTVLHDQGMDGGRIVRDIARTQHTAQSILGTPRPLAWPDIVGALINPTNQRYSAKVDLLDTVVCEHGVPEQVRRIVVVKGKLRRGVFRALILYKTSRVAFSSPQPLLPCTPCPLYFIES